LFESISALQPKEINFDLDSKIQLPIPCLSAALNNNSQSTEPLGNQPGCVFSWVVKRTMPNGTLTALYGHVELLHVQFANCLFCRAGVVLGSHKSSVMPMERLKHALQMAVVMPTQD
jgi:hypothetical protein